MSLDTQTANLTAQNTYTSPLQVAKKSFNLSVSGTWAGTLTLQRSFDGGTTWVDVETYTANTEKVGTDPEHKVFYRIGFKTGEYTSGTAVVRLSH